MERRQSIIKQLYGNSDLNEVVEDVMDDMNKFITYEEQYEYLAEVIQRYANLFARGVFDKWVCSVGLEGGI